MTGSRYIDRSNQMPLIWRACKDTLLNNVVLGRPWHAVTRTENRSMLYYV